MTAKVWIVTRRPEGEPKKTDFTLVEEQLPPCKDGDVIVEAEWLSVDPYMRYRLRDIPLNGTMVGEQVARVIESKNARWPVGTYLLTTCGWRTHTHFTSTFLQQEDNGIQRLPDMEGLPRSLGLGVLGMPGNSAYLAFIEVMRPRAGETVVVSSAAGAVGSIVVQLAKLSGCKVIAFAGSEDKLAWLKQLGADHAFNYKTTNISDAIAKAAPEKVNIYYDNVGGKMTGEVIPHMADRGRVLLCGAISLYNNIGEIRSNTMSSPYAESLILWKELCIKGFIIYRWKHRWAESFAQMKKFVKEGKVQYREHVVNGFNNTPDAFIGLFRGDNIGKAVVKI